MNLTVKYPLNIYYDSDLELLAKFLAITLGILPRYINIYSNLLELKIFTFNNLKSDNIY